MSNVIFIDLDETLVNFITSFSNKRDKITFDCGEHFYGYVRPLATEMLRDLREIAPTRLLTTGMREYALKVNEFYNFKFLPQDILALEDCWVEEQIGYGKDWMTLNKNVSTHSILIDNLPPTETWPRRKMHYLGIKSDRYIQIREFNGKDPDAFLGEWKGILKAIGELFNQ